MKNSIRDIHDLRLEIVRAEAELKESEQKLKTSLTELGHQLTPGKLEIGRAHV